MLDLGWTTVLHDDWPEGRRMPAIARLDGDFIFPARQSDGAGERSGCAVDREWLGERLAIEQDRRWVPIRSGVPTI